MRIATQNRAIRAKSIERIPHTEGEIVKNATGNYIYQYALKDHLGNRRVTFVGNTTALGTVAASDIKQVNHYYPFGMNMEGPAYSFSGVNKMQYNDKELNTDFGLNWNDYGARFYDASIGRWLAVDAYCEGSFRTTPYKYGNNNPIRYFDWGGGFEIPAELTAKYPHLKSNLDKIASKLESNDIMSVNIVKYGQFRDRNQLLNLFKDSNKNIKFGEANLLKGKSKAYADTGGDKSFKEGTSPTDDFKKRRLIRLDESMLSMMENLSKFSKDGQDFAEKLFEAIVIHEITHAGDQQNGEDADAQPLQFAPGSDGKWRPYKEIGEFIEKQIYGRSVQYRDNGDVWNFINNYIFQLTPDAGKTDEKKSKPAPPGA